MSHDQLSNDLASLKIDREPKHRERSFRGLLWLVLILGGIAAVGYFVVYPKLTASLFSPEVRTGQIALVSPAQAQVQVTATGYVVAQVYAKVAAKVPGRIAEIFVEEGQTIEKGSKVARLEDVDFKSALAASRSRGAAARAKIQIARARLAEVKVTIERERPLVEKGVTAKATLDDLQARAGSLVAEVRSAEAEASAADAETKSLEVQLGSYVITTPISGTVVDKLVEVGEGVSPGFGTPGVIEVVDLSSLVVEVDVPEGRLSQITVGAPTEIVLDAYPSKRLRGAVKEIGRRVNRAKATVPVKISFVDRPDMAPAASANGSAPGSGSADAGSGSGSASAVASGSGDAAAAGGSGSATEPPAQVLPDMAARVSFLASALDPAALKIPPKLVVPTNAVAQRDGTTVIFVVDDGEVRMTRVSVGAPFGDGRELETQIPSGTEVVLDPPSDLKDGQKVKEKK